MMMRASRNSLSFDPFLLIEQEKNFADQAIAQVEAEERELPANQNKWGEGMVDSTCPLSKSGRI